jgi:hypothetical protein
MPHNDNSQSSLTYHTASFSNWAKYNLQQMLPRKLGGSVYMPVLSLGDVSGAPAFNDDLVQHIDYYLEQGRAYYAKLKLLFADNFMDMPETSEHVFETDLIAAFKEKSVYLQPAEYCATSYGMGALLPEQELYTDSFKTAYAQLKKYDNKTVDTAAAFDSDVAVHYAKLMQQVIADIGILNELKEKFDTPDATISVNEYEELHNKVVELSFGLAYQDIDDASDSYVYPELSKLLANKIFQDVTEEDVARQLATMFGIKLDHSLLNDPASLNKLINSVVKDVGAIAAARISIKYEMERAKLISLTFDLERCANISGYDFPHKLLGFLKQNIATTDELFVLRQEFSLAYKELLTPIVTNLLDYAALPDTNKDKKQFVQDMLQQLRINLAKDGGVQSCTKYLSAAFNSPELKVLQNKRSRSQNFNKCISAIKKDMFNADMSFNKTSVEKIKELLALEKELNTHDIYVKSKRFSRLRTSILHALKVQNITKVAPELSEVRPRAVKDWQGETIDNLLGYFDRHITENVSNAIVAIDSGTSKIFDNRMFVDCKFMLAAELAEVDFTRATVDGKITIASKATDPDKEITVCLNDHTLSATKNTTLDLTSLQGVTLNLRGLTKASLSKLNIQFAENANIKIMGSSQEIILELQSKLPETSNVKISLLDELRLSGSSDNYEKLCHAYVYGLDIEYVNLRQLEFSMQACGAATSIKNCIIGALKLGASNVGSKTDPDKCLIANTTIEQLYVDHGKVNLTFAGNVTIDKFELNAADFSAAKFQDGANVVLQQGTISNYANVSDFLAKFPSNTNISIGSAVTIKGMEFKNFAELAGLVRRIRGNDNKDANKVAITFEQCKFNDLEVTAEEVAVLANVTIQDSKRDSKLIFSGSADKRLVVNNFCLEENDKFSIAAKHTNFANCKLQGSIAVEGIDDVVFDAGTVTLYANERVALKKLKFHNGVAAKLYLYDAALVRGCQAENCELNITATDAASINDLQVTGDTSGTLDMNKSISSYLTDVEIDSPGFIVHTQNTQIVGYKFKTCKELVIDSGSLIAVPDYTNILNSSTVSTCIAGIKLDVDLFAETYGTLQDTIQIDQGMRDIFDSLKDRYTAAYMTGGKVGNNYNNLAAFSDKDAYIKQLKIAAARNNLLLASNKETLSTLAVKNKLLASSGKSSSKYSSYINVAGALDRGRYGSWQTANAAAETDYKFEENYGEFFYLFAKAADAVQDGDVGSFINAMSEPELTWLAAYDVNDESGKAAFDEAIKNNKQLGQVFGIATESELQFKNKFQLLSDTIDRNRSHHNVDDASNVLFNLVRLAKLRLSVKDIFAPSSSTEEIEYVSVAAAVDKTVYYADRVMRFGLESYDLPADKKSLADNMLEALRLLLRYDYKTNPLTELGRTNTLLQSFTEFFNVNLSNKAGINKKLVALNIVRKVCIYLLDANDDQEWVRVLNHKFAELKQSIDIAKPETEISVIFNEIASELSKQVTKLGEHNADEGRLGLHERSRFDIAYKALEVDLSLQTTGRFNQLLEKTRTTLAQDYDISQDQIVTTHLSKYILPMLVKLTAYKPRAGSGTKSKGQDKQNDLFGLLQTAFKIKLPENIASLNEDARQVAIMKIINEKLGDLGQSDKAVAALDYLVVSCNNLLDGITVGEDKEKASLYTIRDKYYGRDLNRNVAGSAFSELLATVLPQAELARAEIKNMQQLSSYKARAQDEPGQLKQKIINNQLYTALCATAAKSSLAATAALAAVLPPRLPPKKKTASVSNEGKLAFEALDVGKTAGLPAFVAARRDDIAKLSKDLKDSNAVTKATNMIQGRSGFVATNEAVYKNIDTALDRVIGDIQNSLDKYKPKNRDAQGKAKKYIALFIKNKFISLVGKNKFTALREFKNILVNDYLNDTHEVLGTKYFSRKDVGLRAVLQRIVAGIDDTLRDVQHDPAALKQYIAAEINYECEKIVPQLVNHCNDELGKYRVALQNQKTNPFARGKAESFDTEAGNDLKKSSTDAAKQCDVLVQAVAASAISQQDKHLHAEHH